MFSLLRRRGACPLVGAVAIALAIGLVSPSVTRGSPPTGTRIAAWQPVVDFAEGMAVDRAGNAFVSVTEWPNYLVDGSATGAFGQVWKVAPDGTMTAYGPQIPVGEEWGFLTGVALDRLGTVFVGDATGPLPYNGVWRVTQTQATHVVSLPADAFPNGLAFTPAGGTIKGNDLYVTDSAQGAVWRSSCLQSGAVCSTARIWAQSALLEPTEGLGANGLAFRGPSLFVDNWDTGTVVRIPVANDGAALEATVVAQGDDLVGADGMAFDRAGALYVATSGQGTIVRLAPGGSRDVFAEGLLYPTQPAFGQHDAGRTAMLVLNGDYFGIGEPSLMAFSARVPGAPLP